MLKKLLVAIISMNICFSGLAYAQYQPEDELTAEEVEIYMKSIEKREEGLPKGVVIGGGAAALLTLAYSIRKIVKNPELSMFYVASQDPKAYQTLMNAAEKRAAMPAQKKLIKSFAAKETAEMAKWNAAMRHSGRIKAISRANYWKAVSATMAGNWTAANKAIGQMNRAKRLLAMPASAQSSNVLSRMRNNKVLVRAKKAGKWGIVLAVIGYTFLHDNTKEETAISNNRAVLEREIRKMMESDIDALALYVYGLPEDQQRIAYGILAENPEIFAIVKQQVEEAFSTENVDAFIETDNAMREAEYKDSLRLQEEFTPSWTWGE